MINAMKNTITVGLSVASLREMINAQCAWVDVTNLATLPPIVNPTKEGDVDGALRVGMTDFMCLFSGYVESWCYDDDIVRIEMLLGDNPTRVVSRMAHLIEVFVTNGVLANLYAKQPQAKLVCGFFQGERLKAESRLKQFLSKIENWEIN